MKKRLSVAALLLAAIACGNLTGPKDAVSVGQVNGLWVLPFTKTANCSSFGSVGSGTIYLQLNASAGGGNISNTKWGFAANIMDRNATGNVSLANGALTQVLIHYNGVAASRLTGTISANGTFTGTLVDPAPGWQPQITINGCEYSVTGSKQ